MNIKKILFKLIITVIPLSFFCSGQLWAEGSKISPTLDVKKEMTDSPVTKDEWYEEENIKVSEENKIAEEKDLKKEPSSEESKSSFEENLKASEENKIVEEKDFKKEASLDEPKTSSFETSKFSVIPLPVDLSSLNVSHIHEFIPDNRSDILETPIPFDDTASTFKISSLRLEKSISAEASKIAAAPGKVVSPPSSRLISTLSSTSEARLSTSSPESIRDNSIPVIIVPISFADMEIRTPQADIERKLFGPILPGQEVVANYLKLASANHTGIRELKYAETIHLPQLRSENNDSLERGSAIRQILDQHISLEEFDTNRDGSLDQSEIIIIPVVADPQGRGGGGCVRNFCQTVSSTDEKSSVRYCGRMLSISEEASWAVMSHEILHLYGMPDLYTGKTSTNLLLTMMSLHEKILPDPYDLIKRHWVEPRILDLSDARRDENVRCYEISSSESASTHPETGRPILIMDSSTGRNDSFTIELRKRNGYDSHIFQEGYAIWYVSETPEGNIGRFDIALQARSNTVRMRAPAGDDQVQYTSLNGEGTPVLITPGLNGVIDTPIDDTVMPYTANAILNYPPPHLTPTFTTGTPKDRLLGFPELWRNTENPIAKLVWPDPLRTRGGPIDSKIAVRIDDFPSGAENQGRLEIGPYELLENRRNSGIPVCH